MTKDYIIMMNLSKRSASSSNPPGSGKFQKRLLSFESSQGHAQSRQYVNYVLGISGGDCAGKKQLINEMFCQEGQEWFIKQKKQSKQRVTIIHQDYFLKDKTNKFNSNGINWGDFQKAILSLLAGNQYMVVNAKLRGIDILLKPNKLLVIEGSHIFMSSVPIWQYLDCRVFIDSDSDVRLSRRIYKDTQDDGVDLNDSINNYLTNIKPSYEKQIEPCKITSDIIIPHFGGGYDDHRKKEKLEFNSHIQNAKGLILARVREEMIKEKEQQETI